MLLHIILYRWHFSYLFSATHMFIMISFYVVMCIDSFYDYIIKIERYRLRVSHSKSI